MPVMRTGPKTRILLISGILCLVAFAQAEHPDNITARWKSVPKERQEEVIAREIGGLATASVSDRASVMAALHQKYGWPEGKTPPKIQAALADFITSSVQSASDRSSDQMHGGHSFISVTSLSTALSLLSPQQETAVQAADALARSASTDAGIRLHALDLIKKADRDAVLKQIGDDLLKRNQGADRNIALTAYVKMQSPPQDAVEVLSAEIQNPTSPIKETLVVNIPRPNMNPPLVELAVLISKDLPAYASVLLPAVAEASPELLGQHREILQDLSSSSALDDKARTAAKRALERAGNK